MSSRFVPGALLVERTDLAQRPEHRHQHGAAVDHRGVDDLALSAALRLEQGAHHTEGKEHRSPAEVADHVERRCRRLPRPAEVGERPGERDVVDVVTGGVGPRTVLAPPRHPPVHEAPIPRQTHVWSGTEALHHTGPKSFDECVGPLDEIEQHGDAIWLLEVDGDVASTAQRDVDVWRVGRRAAHALARSTRITSAPMSASNMAANGPGPDAGQLDDAVAGERSAHCV